MRILIIGAAGQMGGWLGRELSPRHEVHEAALEGGAKRTVLDIRDETAVRRVIAGLGPDQVILTAALTAVDRCEEEPGLAEDVNVRGPGHVAAACAEAGSGLVFFSTDYIFDGSQGPYREEDPPRPLSVYGRTKLAAERAVAAAVPGHLIIRTTGVFSYVPGSKNFYMQALERARRGEPIRAPRDQWSNPTQAVNLAQATADLMESGQGGIFNLAGRTHLPRDEFARRILRSRRLDESLVRPVFTAELEQKAPRPLRGGLVTAKAEAVLRPGRLWDLDTALAFTLKQMRAEGV